ncbi:hypothetical protein QJQ45_015732 [Haematococcus lacustris]|nr:hypothetical protein QJQ45_015732 [Haematococcus lacustris]
MCIAAHHCRKLGTKRLFFRARLIKNTLQHCTLHIATLLMQTNKTNIFAYLWRLDDVVFYGQKKRRTVPKLVPEDSDSDILDRDEALQPDLTEADRNRKVSGEARAARDRDNTYHGRKCKLAHLIDRLPQELWDAFLDDAVQPRVEACSERAVLASLLLGLLVRGLFAIHVADPLGLHDQPVYTAVLGNWLSEFCKAATLLIVTVPGSVEEERSFSAMNFIKDERRNSLSANLSSTLRVYLDKTFTLKTFPYKEAIDYWMAGASARGRYLGHRHWYTDIPVSQAAIPDLSCRNLFLQLVRGLPGNGANTRPSAAVAAVLGAHPDLRDRLAAIPRHPSDGNMVDHVGKHLETAFSNMLTLLFAGRLKKSVSLAGAKVLLGTVEHQRKFGFRGLVGGHLPAWSKRQCTYVRRMVCGLDFSWLLEEGGVVATAAMQAEVALQRGLLGLEEGQEVDNDWVEDPANRGRLLRHVVHTTREMEAAMAAWQLDMVPWQQAELISHGLLPRPPRPPTPYALTPTSKCQARHVFIDTKGLYGMMRDAGMLGVLTEEGVTSLKKFRNGALPDPAEPGKFIEGPKDSQVSCQSGASQSLGAQSAAFRWDALLPNPRRQKLASPKHSFALIVHTAGVAISVMFLRPKPAAPPAKLPRQSSLPPNTRLDRSYYDKLKRAAQKVLAKGAVTGDVDKANPPQRRPNPPQHPKLATDTLPDEKTAAGAAPAFGSFSALAGAQGAVRCRCPFQFGAAQAGVSAPQHQERVAAQMTALQSAISEDWQHHACASGATRLEDSPLKPLQVMQVEYISMQDRFKLMLPCASSNQSISPNPISFFCWPSSQTHAQTWYDVRVLRSYARMQGCGVSMEGVPQDGYVHCVAGDACNKPSSYAGVAKATRDLEQHTDTYLDRSGLEGAVQQLHDSGQLCLEHMQRPELQQRQQELEQTQRPEISNITAGQPCAVRGVVGFVCCHGVPLLALYCNMRTAEHFVCYLLAWHAACDMLHLYNDFACQFQVPYPGGAAHHSVHELGLQHERMGQSDKDTRAASNAIKAKLRTARQLVNEAALYRALGSGEDAAPGHGGTFTGRLDWPRMGRHMGAVNPLAHLDAEWLGVDPGKTNMATVAHEERSAAGTVVSVRHWTLTAGQYYRDSGIKRQAQATKTWLAEVKTQLTALSQVSSKPSSLAPYRRFADTVLATCCASGGASGGDSQLLQDNPRKQDTKPLTKGMCVSKSYRVRFVTNSWRHVGFAVIGLHTAMALSNGTAPSVLLRRGEPRDLSVLVAYNIVSGMLCIAASITIITGIVVLGTLVTCLYCMRVTAMGVQVDPECLCCPCCTQARLLPRDCLPPCACRKLYEYVRQEAEACKAVGLRLYADSKNLPAQATYQKLGMRTHYLVFEDMFTSY